MFPLLGISFSEDRFSEEIKEKPADKPADKASIIAEKDFLYFGTSNETIFKYRTDRLINEETIKMGRCVIDSFLRISRFSYTPAIYRAKKNYNKPNYKYHSKYQQYKNYELSVQEGITTWIVGNKNDNINRLFLELEKWSVKTYEGKNVTFGFVINQNDGLDGIDWLDLMKDDFSAVFTDCINSAIELNKECKFIRYLSITEGGKINEISPSYELPLRFCNLIQEFVQENKIGIFLLNNGDIIINKQIKINENDKSRIMFVKRNLRWLYFGYEAFENVITQFLGKDKSSKLTSIESNLLKEIFASVLDVSFAHTGGIVAVVNDVSPLLETTGNPQKSVLNNDDYLLNNKKDTTEGTRVVIKKDKEKYKLDKRNFLKSLVKKLKFSELDRKLRSDLIALDGACILNFDGEVAAFGAIIQNDSGSNTGGRGAAAIKLSKYGFAVKISTDGYIELYIGGELKYSIK